MEQCGCGVVLKGNLQKRMKVCALCLATMLKEIKREIRIERAFLGYDEEFLDYEISQEA